MSILTIKAEAVRRTARRLGLDAAHRSMLRWLVGIHPSPPPSRADQAKSFRNVDPDALVTYTGELRALTKEAKGRSGRLTLAEARRRLEAAAKSL